MTTRRAPREQQRGIGRVVVVLVVLVVVLVVGGGYAFVTGRSALEAPSPTHGAPVAIHIAGGETVDQVTDDLATHGLIKSRFWFGLYARFKGLGSHLREGQFLLDNGMGVSAILAKLENGSDVQTVRVTFPEGSTLKQMGDILARSMPISATDYDALAMHPTGFTEAFLTTLPAGAPLEGYLFPDTYDIPTTATAHDVIDLQLQAFQAKALPLLTSTSLSPYQTVVDASIIEREAKFDEDRGLVAGVIANRLATGMRLQVDASVLYGIGVIGRSPTAAELAQDTPYNTYLHAGLPPTPIANPGISTIKAAASPTSTPYVFYVSDCAGHNHYSVDGATHDQQVTQYLSTPCGSS